MRKIKFRGKIKYTRRWIEGYLWRGCNEAFYIKTEELEEFGSTLKDFEVFPETVGQSIGLTDKNGKEIYEGDIVKVSYPRVKFEIQIVPKVGVVRFLDTLPQFVIMGNVEPNCVLVSSFNNTGEEWSVIGSIHDNHELLK